VTVEIRVAGAGELAAGLGPISHYFGMPAGPSEDFVGRIPVPEGRMHVATDGEAVVGGAGVFPFDLTVPGGPVRTAGVTVVGVLPTYRRRGILRDLMRAQLDDIHVRGEPLAALWASEGSIYGRFGYGLGSLSGDMEIPKVDGAFVRPVRWEGSIRLVGRDEALGLFPRVFDRVVASTPGMLARSHQWWDKRVLADSEWRRGGGGELSFAVLEPDGEPEAYAIYRLNFSYTDGVPTGKTVVVEAMGTTPGASAAIWRYLLDIDWMVTVEARLLPLDHPLFLLLLDPNRMRFRVGDGLWVRLVDVGAALAARSYAGDGGLVFEVADEFCGWNEGRWALDGSRTTAAPDLRLSVDALGCVYLGGFSFAELLRAGRVEEATPGAVARADALFRTDAKPWCPEIF
jgi:predicted acetyltransferase